MCWVALDRAAKIAVLLNKHGYGEQWNAEAALIKEEVFTHGWKEELQSFSQCYENQALDSSLLLMEPYGFISADDVRYHKTVRAVKEALMHWLIRALYVIGQREEARCLFEEVLTYGNHLGLFSEDINFDTKELLGNFPQAYSHLALVNTAILLSRESKQLKLK